MDGLEFLPNRLAAARSGREVRAPALASRFVPGPPHVTGFTCTDGAGGRISMKVVVSFLLVFALVCSAAPPAPAEPRQVIQGTQIRLTLLTGISSAVAREGDPFIAVVSAPVFLGNQLLIPAGTRVNGIIGTIQPAKRFSLSPGQAYMNLTCKSLEADSRMIPVLMSILSLEQP